ncbi:MAG: YccF domain-containing protein [Prevotella sp.]|jgi:uncharacterized membrane protein YccF (DUF307 family)|nr:YccF domain-containing protein [Parabacteroides sp.]
MKIIGNIIWLIFGGLETGIEYFVSSIGMMITIIGIPFGIASLRIGLYVLWPFGQKVVDRPNNHGCLDTIMNIIWFFIGGVWIWLTHLLFGTLLCITIIGIPFGKKQFHLAGLALAPFGKQVIPA